MNPARREPLLWLQLLGLAALPLEALLLLLTLAGADPGFLPGFERVLTWALGALAPAVLFWRLPPDLWSLLLLQVPLRGRRPEQLQLSALQTASPLKLLAASGAALLLPLLWWTDASAGLAWAWSPLSASPRLVTLLVSLPVLALMQWQWHQLIQALWLLSRPASLIEQTLPLSQSQAAEERLNLGLPLLLLQPLAMEPTAATEPTQLTEPTQPIVEAATIEPEPSANPEPPEAPEPESEAEPTPETDESDALAELDGSATAVVEDGIAVTPEQEPEQAESTNLNSEVTEGDELPS